MTHAAPPTSILAAADPGRLLVEWLEVHRGLLDAGFEQAARSQHMLLQSWTLWMQVFWAPWTPFLERGGEQLA